MKKENIDHIRFGSITDAHRFFGLPSPAHPLISLIHSADTCVGALDRPNTHILSFYKISYRPKFTSKLRYGQHYYDFDEGGLLFAAPGQILGRNDHEANSLNDQHSQHIEPRDTPLYTLLIHPDYLRTFPLSKKIKEYGFFSYSTNEALHLSETEKATIISIFSLIDQELKSRIDDHSQQVVIAQIELLLSYADRFYKRQFITRRAVSNDMLQQLEELTNEYFNDTTPVNKGLPTVAYLAEALHLSPSYLSDMLRSLIGQTAQQYIHGKLIDKAKEQLSSTSLSVGEIAYLLGFEHPQSFNKLFKSKTNVSPLEFRSSFQ